MPTANRCPRCTTKVPSRAVRCIACGAAAANLGRDEPRRRTAIRGLGPAVGVLLTVCLLAMTLSDRWVPVVADWYAGMALRLQAEPSRLVTAAPDDDEAFFVCARAVVRRVGTESSIATFATRETAISQLLGDGRLQLRSYLEEAGESGDAQRHVFTCTVRQLAGVLVLEDLEIEAVERLPFDLAIRAR